MIEHSYMQRKWLYFYMGVSRILQGKEGINMTNLDGYNKKFGIAEKVEFMVGEGGLPIVRISNALGVAHIALQGAHVLDFQAHGQQPLIWMSEDATYKQGKSLRGGAPICWPWFGGHAEDTSLPGHGPARTVDWLPIKSETLADGRTLVSFEIQQTNETQAMCNHPLLGRLHVTVGSSLDLVLETTNLGDTSFELGAALHTYFQVGDVRQASIEGLEGCTYLDKVDRGAHKVQQGPVTIEEETDRIYLGVSKHCTIIDPVMKRRISIESQGSASTVVWNPWSAVAEKMGDLGQDGYLNMLCVETANAASNVIELAAGATHQLHAKYTSLPL